MTLTPLEDGGIGALIMAILWAIAEWFKYRRDDRRRGGQ